MATKKEAKPNQTVEEQRKQAGVYNFPPYGPAHPLYMNLPQSPVNPQMYQMMPNHSWSPQTYMHINHNTNANHTNLKICLFCKREPTFGCGRCGAYYCSQECQRQDWQNHRFTCFIMPHLIPLKEKPKTVPVTPAKSDTRNTPPVAQLPKNQSLVIVTGFRRPNLCYVRSLDPQNKELYSKSVSQINNFGNSALPLTEVPASNTYAIALYEQTYHRVQVLSTNEQAEVRVLFIDQGFVRTIKLKCLREITEKIINILQHTVAIKLKGVVNYMVNEEIENFLSTFRGKDFILDYGEDADKCKEFNLQLILENTSLNALISKFANEQQKLDIFENTESPKSPETVLPNTKGAIPKANSTCINKEKDLKIMKPVLKPPFQVIQFDKDTLNFSVVVLNNASIELGLFGCILRHNQKYMTRIQTYLAKYNDTNQSYKPQLDEYCLAKINKKWKRAKVQNINNNIYTVINIDTTAQHNVVGDNLRYYPEDFDVPCSTVICKIIGLLPNNGNILINNFLKKRFTLNSVHRINKVDKIDNDITHVHMDELIDDLILDFQDNN